MSKRLTTVLMAAALAGTVVSGALPAAALADTGSQLQVQESYGTWERSGGRWWFATQGDTSEFYFFYEDGTMARNEWVDTGKYGTIYFGSDGIGTPGQ